MARRRSGTSRRGAGGFLSGSATAELAAHHAPTSLGYAPTSSKRARRFRRTRQARPPTASSSDADGAANQACLAVLIYVTVVAALSMADALFAVALFAIWAASFGVWAPCVIRRKVPARETARMVCRRIAGGAASTARRAVVALEAAIAPLRSNLGTCLLRFRSCAVRMFGWLSPSVIGSGSDRDRFGKADAPRSDPPHSAPQSGPYNAVLRKQRPTTCGGCSAVLSGKPRKVCKDCRSRCYCDRSCQKRHWNRKRASHREECGLLRQLRGGSEE